MYSTLCFLPFAPNTSADLNVNIFFPWYRTLPYQSRPLSPKCSDLWIPCRPPWLRRSDIWHSSRESSIGMYLCVYTCMCVYIYVRVRFWISLCVYIYRSCWSWVWRWALRTWVWCFGFGCVYYVVSMCSGFSAAASVVFTYGSVALIVRSWIASVMVVWRSEFESEFV